MRLSVTTPQGALVEADVDEVTAPGALGEFGVLPGHVPFLSALQPGVFVFRNKDGSRILAVSEGVLEVARADSELAQWSKELGGEYKALVTQRAWAAARVAASARLSVH